MRGEESGIQGLRLMDLCDTEGVCTVRFAIGHHVRRMPRDQPVASVRTNRKLFAIACDRILAHRPFRYVRSYYTRCLREEQAPVCQAASRALEVVMSAPATIDCDVAFVEQAVRVGAFDAVQRTQALRRLVEAGRSADTAVRDFRAARAAWLRRAAIP
jgi:hypothetical protein